MEGAKKGGRTMREGAPIRNLADSNTHASTAQSHTAPDAPLRSPTPQGQAGKKKRDQDEAGATGRCARADSSQAIQLDFDSSVPNRNLHTRRPLPAAQKRQTNKGETQKHTAPAQRTAQAAARTDRQGNDRTDCAPTVQHVGRLCTDRPARTHRPSIDRPARTHAQTVHRLTSTHARTDRAPTGQLARTVHRPNGRRNATTR